MRIVGAVTIAGLTTFCAPASPPQQAASTAGCEFGPAQSLGALVNSSRFEGSPTVSADETELLFTSARAGQQDIFRSTRPGKNSAWTEPVNAGPLINDPVGDDFSLRLSNDGNTLYFASNRSGGYGSGDIYMATRASREGAWGQAANLGPRLNTEAFEAFPSPSADGHTLYFNRSTTFDSQDSDIWMSTRSGNAGEWTAPHLVAGEVNTPRAEFSPSLTTDDNTMYFASERSGSVQIWVVSRAERTLAWGSSRALGAHINSPGSMTLAPFISVDARSLYFMSARPDAPATATCTPMTCFDRLDLYVSTVTCPTSVSR